MKKRMCKYYSTTKYGWLCGRADTHNRECPPHSNWCCEIIPAKPKVVKVKAWAVLMQVQVDKLKNTWRTQVDYASHKPDAMFVSVPCTITIAAKYLKPAKGKGK